jgi:exopolyphosphatase/pppGpp-phosphohydrolase
MVVDSLKFSAKVKSLMIKYSGGRGESHFRQVTRLALSIFDQMSKQNIICPENDDRMILWSAAMLHDIGVVAHSEDESGSHAWCSADMILNELSDFQLAKEIALVASLHRHEEGHDYDIDPVGPVYPGIGKYFPNKTPENLLLLAGILRVADGFDRYLDSCIRSVLLKDNKIYAEPPQTDALEYARRKQNLLKKLSGTEIETPRC